MPDGLGRNPYEDEEPPEEERKVPPIVPTEAPEVEGLPPIPPEGITYTVEDKEGNPLELHILEDFEYVGTKRTLRSPNYNVYHEKTQIGTYMRETGEFVSKEPTWWEKTLGVGTKTLEYAFLPFAVVGQMTRDWWERLKATAPWLSEEEREQRLGELEADIALRAKEEGIKQILPGGTKYEEFRALPWYQQIAFELPAWIGLSAMGLSAIKGRAAAKALPAVARVPVRAALAPMAGYEWAVGKTIQITYNTTMSTVLKRNLHSWAKSAGVKIPKATEDAFIKQAVRQLSPKFMAKEAAKTLFRPTKVGYTITEAGASAAETVAAQAVRTSPLLLGTGKAAVSTATIKAVVIPPLKPPTVLAVPEALEGGFSGMFFRTEVAKAPPSGVTFFSKNRDYAEELQTLRGKGVIREESLTVTNPLVVEVTERQLADPDFEKPYIDKAIAKGNDAAVFFNRATGDIFVATIKPPAVEVAKPPVEPLVTLLEEALATTAQKAKAHIVALDKALIDATTKKLTPQYRRLAQNITGKKSMKDMTSDEASAFIEALEKYPEKRWSTRTGKWIPQAMPVTKAIVPEDYFAIKFGEPTPIKYFTSQNFYATKLGVSPLTQPLEIAKQELDLVFPAWGKAIDLKIKALNKAYKVTGAEKLVAFRNNLPTRASKEMALLLNKYEDLPAKIVDELGTEKVAIFSWFRNLSRTILNGQNEVRGLLNMPLIPHHQAYLRHIATETSKEIWRGNYSLPSDLAYWSRRVVGKKVFNPMAMPRQMTDDLLEYFSKDLGYLTKSMIHTGLKEIYLSQPLKAFTTQLNVLSKGMMPFSSLSPTELEKAQLVSVLPASTHKWVVDYVNQVIKGQQTELDASINRIITQSGIGGVFDKFLKEFGRSIGTRPVTKMAQFSGRLIISATIGTKPRQIIRNLWQPVQDLALNGIEATLASVLPAGKPLSRLMNNSMFLKSYARYEELPTSAMGKAERIWMWSYGKSAIFNARRGMKASYLSKLHYITNQADVKYGWASPQRTYTEPKGFLYDDEIETLLREMEFSAGCTQYQYIGIGMPEVFRHKTLIPFTRLQSWWMNYFFKFNREAIHRFWNGSVGWNPDLKLNWKDRLNWMKYVILGGAILTALGYKRSFMKDVLPHWGSPAAQMMTGAYSYVTADSDWAREKAKKTMFYSIRAFAPGAIDYKSWLDVWTGEKPMSSLFFYGENWPPDMPTWGIPSLEEEAEIKRQIKYINDEIPKFRTQLGTFIPAEDDIEGYTYEVSDFAAEIRALTRDIPPERLTEEDFSDIVLMYKKAETLWDTHYYSLLASARQEWLQQSTPESIWTGAYLVLWGKLKATGWVSGNPQTIALIGQLMDEYNIPTDAVSGARDVPELRGRGEKPTKPLKDIIDDFRSAKGDAKFNFLEQAVRQHGQRAVKDSLATGEVAEYTWDIRSFDWRREGILVSLVHWGNEFYKVFDWLSGKPNIEQLERVKRRVPDFNEIVLGTLLPIYQAEPRDEFPEKTWISLLQLAVEQYGADELKRLVEAAHYGPPNQWDRIQAEIDRLSGGKPPTEEAPPPPREEGLGPSPYE